MQSINDNTTAPDDRAAAVEAVTNLCAAWEKIGKPYRPPPPEKIHREIPANYDKTDLFQVCLNDDLSTLQDSLGKNIWTAEEINNGFIIFVMNKPEITRILIDHGADVHTNDDDALKWAACCGQIETVRLLIARGANIHADNNKSLRFAAVNGYTEVARLLLTHGADIHAEEDDALFSAAQKRHPETVALLIEYGAPLEKLIPDQQYTHTVYLTERERLKKLFIKKYKDDQSLTKIFNAKTWAGHVPEMLELWSQIPEPLQTGFDFQHILSETKTHTLKQRSKAKITFTK
jgi:hypothetical protein